MKKTLLAIAFFMVSLAVLGQKPVGGDILTEAEFNLNFNKDNFTLPSLRFRYFIADKLAARIDLSANGTSETNNFYQYSNGTGGTGSYTLKNSTSHIGLGLEKHFEGNERLSPFAAAMIGFGGTKTTIEGENSDGNAYRSDYKSTGEIKYKQLDASIRLGCDFWVGEYFYLGTELGYGFNSQSRKETDLTVIQAGNTTKQVIPENKNKSFGEFIAPAFRIGFILK